MKTVRWTWRKPSLGTVLVCPGCPWIKLEENQCSGRSVVFPCTTKEEKERIWNWDSATHFWRWTATCSHIHWSTVSTVHHPLKILFVLKKSRVENKKHKAQHAHWHATCFILKYRWIVITIRINLFTEGDTSQLRTGKLVTLPFLNEIYCLLCRKDQNLLTYSDQLHGKNI